METLRAAVRRSGGRAVVCLTVLLTARPPDRLTAQDWPVHSLERPRPAVVDPGPERPPVAPPADAIVLFDGTSLGEWEAANGGPPAWLVRDGHMEVVGRAGGIRTRRLFGDVQLHVEWAAPAPPRGEGQARGNSGVFLMSHYEIQVLDSYRNDTYADGQAGALYGQQPPLVNVCRPPGAWQSYDIVFRRPRFGGDGALLEPARVTMFHNGVLVHDRAVLAGRTAHATRARYEAHADRLPIVLQDHGDPVRFRNIWVRELADHE
jgi:3-keto-disaccharide hydrolase